MQLTLPDSFGMEYWEYNHVLPFAVIRNQDREGTLCPSQQGV